VFGHDPAAREEFVAGIKVMSAGAVKSMVAALGAEFEWESGKKLDLNFGTAGSLRAHQEWRSG